MRKQCDWLGLTNAYDYDSTSVNVMCRNRDRIIDIDIDYDRFFSENLIYDKDFLHNEN